MKTPRATALVAALAATGLAATSAAQTQTNTGTPPTHEDVVYRVYVACESSDQVYRVAFDGEKAETERIIDVGYQPTEIEGPHGLAVGLDGEHWYLSIAHGKPFGLLYKYRTSDDEMVGECELGMFPATMQISPATGLLYCVNFNLHGRMLPSTVSIVDPEAMVEVARTVTGAMPHGSRLGPKGKYHYSCAMMSGHLFEIDAATFKVVRDLQLDIEPPAGHESEAKPTWVHPHPIERKVYCALNGKAAIVEVDLDRWVATRRFATGKGPYNLEISPDGKVMVATYKTDGAIGIWDLAEGRELARIDTTRSVAHGVVISPDNRYAFVTAEAKNADPGALDIFDLQTHKKVASVPVGLQAGGIAFWKMGPR